MLRKFAVGRLGGLLPSVSEPCSLCFKGERAAGTSLRSITESSLMGLMAARKMVRQDRARDSAGSGINVIQCIQNGLFTIRIIIWTWRMEGLWIDRCEACSS